MGCRTDSRGRSGFQFPIGLCMSGAGMHAARNPKTRSGARDLLCPSRVSYISGFSALSLHNALLAPSAGCKFFSLLSARIPWSSELLLPRRGALTALHFSPARASLPLPSHCRAFLRALLAASTRALRPDLLSLWRALSPVVCPSRRVQLLLWWPRVLPTRPVRL